MVVYRDVYQQLAVFHKFKSFLLTFSFNVVCSVIFSQYPNVHNSYVNCFMDSFNCKRDASSVLMQYCPESCIWKVKYLYINGRRNSLLIHGFSLVNARLLKAFGTAFYSITLNKRRSSKATNLFWKLWWSRVQNNSRLSLSRLWLSRITAYLEKKI